MSQSSVVVSVAVSVLLVLGACVEAPALDSTSQAVSNCPTWGCGENSPKMGPYEEHEYDASGHELNKEGSRLAGLYKNGVRYQPSIVNGTELIGEAADGTLLTGTALTGAFFLIVNRPDSYKIIIKKVTPRAASMVRFWIGPPTQIETYELYYQIVSRVATHPEPLCKNPPERDAGEGNLRLWYAPLEAILFTGDRYRADLKTVTAASYAEAGDWFNIACAGSALAKLHLNRHTTAGSITGFSTLPSERQTLLKMYTCDVCGDGQSWTEQGTKLRWTNTKHWSNLDGSEFDHEALWGPDGALCLDTHRLGNTMRPLIDATCGRPACPNVPLGGSLPGGAYILTAVPQNPF